MTFDELAKVYYIALGFFLFLVIAIAGIATYNTSKCELAEAPAPVVEEEKPIRKLGETVYVWTYTGHKQGVGNVPPTESVSWGMMRDYCNIGDTVTTTITTWEKYGDRDHTLCGKE